MMLQTTGELRVRMDDTGSKAFGVLEGTFPEYKNEGRKDDTVRQTSGLQAQWSC
jgi:hypothetical protein